MRRGLGLLCVLALGCASGGGPSGSGDTDTDTASSSSFGPSTTADTSTDESNDSSDSVEPETTFESQSGGGTSSSGSSSESTGCPLGTMGCPCEDVDPVCDDGLECVRDMCVAPLCAMKEYENNDAFNDASNLGDFDDSDPDQMFSSALSGTTDIDWFTYTCTDTLLEDLVPTLAMETSMPMHVCFFIDCMFGGNPLFDCPEGTTPEQAPIGFVPGCCVDDASDINLSDYNCPDSDNDGVIVHIKAEMGAADMCIDYSMTYTC